MVKRERIEREFDLLSIDANKQIKKDRKESVIKYDDIVLDAMKIKINKIKREREEEILNEISMEKKYKLETEEYKKNHKSREERLKKLHESMYI